MYVNLLLKVGGLKVAGDEVLRASNGMRFLFFLVEVLRE